MTAGILVEMPLAVGVGLTSQRDRNSIMTEHQHRIAVKILERSSAQDPELGPPTRSLVPDDII